MPEQPKQVTAFLSFPKAGQHVSQWQIARRMLESVIVFEIVIENDGKEAGRNSLD